MKTKISFFEKIVFLFFLISFSNFAHASLEPGFLILFKGMHMENSSQWLGAFMFMSIGIEAALYKYWKLFKRPILTSILLNFASLLMTVPLFFISFIDPTRFLLPIFLSATVEGLVGLKFQLYKKEYWPKIYAANFLTTLIMIAYFFLAVAKSEGMWFPSIYALFP